MTRPQEYLLAILGRLPADDLPTDAQRNALQRIKDRLTAADNINVELRRLYRVKGFGEAALGMMWVTDQTERDPNRPEGSQEEEDFVFTRVRRALSTVDGIVKVSMKTEEERFQIPAADLFANVPPLAQDPFASAPAPAEQSPPPDPFGFGNFVPHSSIPAVIQTTLPPLEDPPAAPVMEAPVMTEDAPGFEVVQDQGFDPLPPEPPLPELPVDTANSGSFDVPAEAPVADADVSSDALSAESGTGSQVAVPGGDPESTLGELLERFIEAIQIGSEDRGPLMMSVLNQCGDMEAAMETSEDVRQCLAGLSEFLRFVDEQLLLDDPRVMNLVSNFYDLFGQWKSTDGADRISLIHQATDAIKNAKVMLE